MFSNQARKESQRGMQKKGKGVDKKGGGGGGGSIGPVHDPVKCLEAVRLGSRRWAHFASDVDDGRDLFRRLNSDAIREAARDIKAGNSGAAHAKALKNLWERANQEEWNKMAKKQIDIFQFVVFTLFSAFLLSAAI